MREGSPFGWLKKVAGIAALGAALHGAPGEARGEEPQQRVPGRDNSHSEVTGNRENAATERGRNPNIIPADEMNSILKDWDSKDDESGD